MGTRVQLPPPPNFSSRTAPTKNLPRHSPRPAGDDWPKDKAEAKSPRRLYLQKSRHTPPYRYDYILQSDAHPTRHNTGQTDDLRSRLAKHNEGGNPNTSDFRPWHPSRRRPRPRRQLRTLPHDLLWPRL